MYPVAAEGTKLENLINSLNGGNAIVLEQTNLNPQLKAIHEAVIEKADEIDDWEERYRNTGRAVQIMLDDKKVLWITPLTSFSCVKVSYIAYGNEASIGYRYRNICLVVKKPVLMLTRRRRAQEGAQFDVVQYFLISPPAR